MKARLWRKGRERRMSALLQAAFMLAELTLLVRQTPVSSVSYSRVPASSGIREQAELQQRYK